MFVRIISFLVFFSSFLLPAIAQRKGGVLYVVDSEIVDHRKTVLNPSDVATVNVLRPPETLEHKRYERYDSVLFIFTHAYLQRPAAVKKLIRPDQLRFSQGDYLYRQRPFTGKVVQFNFDGSVQYEGMIKNGRPVGTHFSNQFGQIPHYIVYNYGRNGRKEVVKKDTLGTVLERAIWQTSDAPDLEELFYPNGQVKYRLIRSDRGIRYTRHASNGRLLHTFIKGETGKRWNASNVEFEKNPLPFRELILENQYAAATARYPGRADVYDLIAKYEAFNRRFDPALRYIDTAIALEPLEPEYYLLRAETRLRKYVYEENSKNGEEAAFYKMISTYPRLNIPAIDRQQIIADLRKAKTYYTPRKHGNALYDYVGSDVFDESVSNFFSGSRPSLP